MKPVLISTLLLFTCTAGSAQTLTVGALAGAPVKTNSLLWALNDDAVLWPGKEKHHSVNYGAFVQFAPRFMNKNGKFKNAFEIKWGINTRKFDWQVKKTEMYYNQPWHYSVYYTYKQQNFNLSAGVTHREFFGAFSISGGAGFQYIHYQQADQLYGYDYWDNAGKWTGMLREINHIPGGYSVGVMCNLGVAYHPVKPLSIGLQLNFGVYNTRITGDSYYEHRQYYWDSFNWIDKKTVIGATFNRDLITTSPVIPEIRIAWSFDFSKYRCMPEKLEEPQAGN